MISERLQTGKENAMTGRELAAQLHCSIRVITAQIEKERREGQPICATACGKNPGYYLAETQEDIALYCAAIKRRAVELFKTRQALISVLKQLPEKKIQAEQESAQEGE